MLNQGRCGSTREAKAQRGARGGRQLDGRGGGGVRRVVPPLVAARRRRRQTRQNCRRATRPCALGDAWCGGAADRLDGERPKASCPLIDSAPPRLSTKPSVAAEMLVSSAAKAADGNEKKALALSGAAPSLQRVNVKPIAGSAERLGACASKAPNAVSVAFAPAAEGARRRCRRAAEGTRVGERVDGGGATGAPAHKGGGCVRRAGFDRRRSCRRRHRQRRSCALAVPASRPLFNAPITQRAVAAQLDRAATQRAEWH